MSTITAPTGQQTEPRPQRRSVAVRVVRAAGWALIAAGAVVVLFVVYLLFFTNSETARAQDKLQQRWALEVGDTDPALPREPVGEELADDEASAPIAPGDAYAAMWFERAGSDEPIVGDETLFVVEDVSTDALKRGPGHYPETGPPGESGNFAVAGHRTTYGAPFYHLDQLQPGDEIHIVDRQRREWVYVVADTVIVQPTELWVIGQDPLGTGRPTLTLTTCYPRFSDAERLIVFAELPDDIAGG